MSRSLNTTTTLRQLGAVPPCPHSLCGRCTAARCPTEALKYKAEMSICSVHCPEMSLTSITPPQAKMYRDSAYCVVVPGDSLITPRIFSYVQAGCIPVFPYARSLLPRILPLSRSISWADLSVSLDLRLVANWSKHGHPPDDNPLRTVLAADKPRLASPRQRKLRLSASRSVDFDHSALSAIAFELAHVVCRSAGHAHPEASGRVNGVGGGGGGDSGSGGRGGGSEGGAGGAAAGAEARAEGRRR